MLEVPLNDAAAAANGYSIPGDSWFHGGGQSWYEGWFFNVPHAVDDPNNPGGEVHIDPVGPILFPLHAVQILSGWLGGTQQLGQVQCTVGLGCD